MEDFACLLILCFYGMAGAIPGISPNQASEMTGALPSGLMFAAGISSQLLINGLILVLVLRHAPRLLVEWPSLHFAAAFSGLAVLSAAWSQDPILSARRALPFALAMLFGLYLATRYPLQQQLLLFERAFLLLAIGSAVLALGFPALGLDASTGHAGNWQGVFTQKNACGRAMVFATATIFAQGRINRRRAASFAIFLVVLARSGSRGAWVIEALLLTLVLTYTLLSKFDVQPRRWLGGAALVTGLAAAVLLKVYFAPLARLLGRDPTLTGRTEIWAQVWLAILKRPWLGYGFSAFWRGTRGASFEVVVALKFILFHAHNGFLEIWLELGVAGLLLFMLSYLRGWQQLLPQLWRAQEGGFRPGLWPLCMLFLIAAYNIDENTLLSFNGLFWVLYTHALVSIQLGATRSRAAMPSQLPYTPPWFLAHSDLEPRCTRVQDVLKPTGMSLPGKPLWW